MKTRTIFFAILFQTILLFGSNTFKVTMGQAYDAPKKHYLLESHTFENGEIIKMYLSAGVDIIIYKFDKSLKLIKTSTIDVKALPKAMESIGVYKLSDNYYWFYSTYDKSTKTDQLQSVKFDLEKLQIIGQPTVIIKTSHRLTSYDPTSAKFNFRYSSDSSKILFNTSRFYPDVKDDNLNYEKRAIAVFNSNMEKLFSYEIKMPYVETKLSYITMKVDNMGNAYLFTKINESGNKIKNQEKLSDVTHYEILTYNSTNATSPIIKKIQIKGKNISTFNVVEQQDHDVLIFGRFNDFKQEGQKDIDVKKGIYLLTYKNIDLDNMVDKAFSYFPDDKEVGEAYVVHDDLKNIYYVSTYSNKKVRAGVDGVFILRLDNLEEGTVNLKKSFYEIPSSVIKSYTQGRETKKLNEKEEKGVNIGDRSLKFSQILTFSDGSIALVGEEYFMETHTHCDSKGNCYTTYTYNYNDIIVAKFNTKLEVISFNKIPKMSEGSMNPGNLSYNVILNKDKLHFFYLDNPENLNIKENTSPTKLKAKGILVCATIDEAGTMTRTKVLDLSQMDYSYFEISNFDWNPYTGLLTGNLSGGPKKLPKLKIISIGVQ